MVQLKIGSMMTPHSSDESSIAVLYGRILDALHSCKAKDDSAFEELRRP